MAYKAYNLKNGKYTDKGNYYYNFWWGEASGGSFPLHVRFGYGSGSTASGPVKVTIAMAGSNILYNYQIVGNVCTSYNKDTYLTNDAWRWYAPGTSVTLTFSTDEGFYGVCYQWSVTTTAPSLPVGQPSGGTSVYNVTQTTAQRSATVYNWGTNGSAGSWSWYYGPGNYNTSSGGSTYATLTGLTPDTTYTYRFKVWNAQGKEYVYKNSFKTLPYTPPTSYLSYGSVTNNSITMNYSTSGANVSQLRIYVNGSVWRTINAGNSGSITVTGLSPKTSYNIQVQAYTPDGSLWGNTTAAVSATTYPNPVYVKNAAITAITPFTATVGVTSSAANDTNGYGYTLLNANKGVIQGEKVTANSSYTFTNLLPEITYYARVRVRTSSSNIWSSYIDIPFTTPADQAEVYIKVNNLWRKGKVFAKIQGGWLKCKNLYTKVKDNWKKNNNY